jgi:hypothetical protein
MVEERNGWCKKWQNLRLHAVTASERYEQERKGQAVTLNREVCECSMCPVMMNTRSLLLPEYLRAEVKNLPSIEVAWTRVSATCSDLALSSVVTSELCGARSAHQGMHSLHSGALAPH